MLGTIIERVQGLTHLFPSKKLTDGVCAQRTIRSTTLLNSMSVPNSGKI